jgi:hypothetical protein
MKIKFNYKDLQENIFLLFISFAAAFICNLIFIRIASSLMPGLPNWHKASMLGEIAAPLQYRLLSFLIPDLYSKLMRVSIVDAYLAIRLISLAISFWFSALTVKKLTSQPLAPTLIILAISFYYAASTQAHLQPAEEPNLLAFSIFIWLLVSGSGIVPLSIIFALGALNKDTVGFLIPFVFLYRWLHQKQLLCAFVDCAVLSVIFFAGYFGVRLYYGTDRPYLGDLWQAGKNLNFLIRMPVRGSMWMLTSLLPMAYLIFNWKKTPLIVKCFMPTVLLFVGGHILISITDEFRTYTPLALMMWTGVIMVTYPHQNLIPPTP